MKAKKQGQLSYFVIVGLVILLGAALMLYTESKKNQESFLEESTEDIPTEIFPVHAFITECLEKTSKEVLIKIGEQAGYYSPSEFGITPMDFPTDGPALTWGEQGTPIPYWHYMSSSNRCNGDCQFSTKRPEITSIETQLREATLQNLDFCLNGFRPLEAQGYLISEESESALLSQIGRQDVRLKLEMPLKINKEGNVYALHDFFVVHDVELRKIHELASIIAASQAEYRYLERASLNLLSAFSGIGEGLLPPLALTTIAPQQAQIWTFEETKSLSQQILVNYMALFQVPGTQNYIDRSAQDAYVVGNYGLFDLPLYSTQEYSFNNLQTTFRYHQWWEPFFELKGRGVKGGLVGPEEGFIPDFSFLVFRRYNTYYDLSFPVMVEIRDESAFGGEGYNFRIALESNIRENSPLQSTYFNPGRINANDIQLLCNPNQRNSGQISLSLKDGRTTLGVAQARVSFACGQESCLIGQTDETGNLVEKFPVCSGGKLLIDKLGYPQIVKDLTTSLDKAHEDSITMEPYREIPVKVFKRRYSKSTSGWFYEQQPIDLLDNEVVYLHLTDMNTGYETATVVQGNELPNLRLLPGNYKIEGTLAFTLPAYGIDRITIAEETQMVGPFWDRQEVTLPAIEFTESFTEGGVIFENWELTKEELDSASQINIFALAPIASNSFDKLTHDDLERLNQITQLSAMHKTDMKPVLSK